MTTNETVAFWGAIACAQVWAASGSGIGGVLMAVAWMVLAVVMTLPHLQRSQP